MSKQGIRTSFWCLVIMICIYGLSCAALQTAQGKAQAGAICDTVGDVLTSTGIPPLELVGSIIAGLGGLVFAVHKDRKEKKIRKVAKAEIEAHEDMQKILSADCKKKQVKIVKEKLQNNGVEREGEHLYRKVKKCN